jgi:uncharacterized surface protein with fasciclin (FAS1) repeats
MLLARATAFALACATVEATRVYIIQDGQCGESDVPSWAVGFAQLAQRGLQRGRCGDSHNGITYTVPIGTSSAQGQGQLGQVAIQLYAPTGTAVCTAADIASMTTACSQFSSTTDAGICGSPCETQVRASMQQACDLTNDLHDNLQTITARCDGFVPISSTNCHDGLFFQAFQPTPAEFDFLDLQGVLIDQWTPVVEHPEHTQELWYPADADFVNDIAGFNATDQYVMRWRGTVQIPSDGDYQFSTTSDDGSLLYIDNQVVVNNDGRPPVFRPRTRSGTVTLSAGPHSIKIDFFENNRRATMGAQWTPTPGAALTHMTFGSGSAFSNNIGCGDDMAARVGVGERCAVDSCLDPSDCPQCEAGLECEPLSPVCAGTCFGTCAADQAVQCQTCSDLSWPAGIGAFNTVCGESDDGFACTQSEVHSEAELTCHTAGGRLCTADELIAEVGRGTGCGHDSHMVWSSSDSFTLNGVTTTCQNFEKVVVRGTANTATPPTCQNIQQSGAATRCCADTVCSTTPTNPNIVQVAQSLPQFSTLVTAVTTANLATTLSGPGPFTVFAPPNTAFAALDTANPGTIAALLADAARLSDVLTFHVASGQVLSTDLHSGMHITTVEGKVLTVRIRSTDNSVTIVGPRQRGVRQARAHVTQADVMASNGVIHVIDAVLVPPPLSTGGGGH